MTLAIIDPSPPGVTPPRPMVILSPGENTLEAGRQAAIATLAANSATAAGNYFSSQAAGEAGTVSGEFFSHPDGAGGLVYRERTGGGSTIIGYAATKAQVDARVASADLASNSGFTLVKHKRSESGTFGRTAAQMDLAGMFEDGGVNVHNWIDPDYDIGIRNLSITGVDLAPSLNAAFSWCSSNARVAVVSDGLFPAADTIDIGNGTMRIRGTGYSVLKYTGAAGTGIPVLRADRGDLTGSPGEMSVSGLILDGGGNAGVGLYSRGCNRSFWRNIRTRNVTTIGFHILGDVLSEWANITSSVNYADQLTNPAVGMRIEGTGAVASSTRLKITNLSLEGATGNGLEMLEADDCQIDGSSEANGGLGVFVGPTCTLNRLSLFCEANAAGDVDCYGTFNEFDGAYNSHAPSAPYISVPSALIRAGATGTKLRGRYFAVAIEAIALSTDIREAKFRAFAEVGEADITDAGTGTKKTLAANADTSGAVLAALETEVNELKAVLRTHGLIA